MLVDLAKYASQGYGPVVRSSSLFKDWGDLCFTPVCRELACLERALKDDLNNWSNFLPQFSEQEWFELIWTGCLERFQILKEL